MSFIDLQDISASYDKKTMVLNNFNLTVEKGEFVSLLGPSGCGKTTTLRILSGFINPSKGKFFVDGVDYTNVPVHKRNFGIVFQSYALFPHLTVFENVAFGLRMRKVKADEIKSRVEHVLKLMDMFSFAQRFPEELSGGQRQRVAIARSIVVEPKILLLDEPLSNLDAKLRLKMRVEIRKLQQQLGITTVFVTHDQEECFSISDKVAVMNKGIVEQYDSPEVIYQTPATEFIARFVGFENFINVTNKSGSNYTADGGFELKTDVDEAAAKSSKVAAIRPDYIQILNPGENFDYNALDGKVLVRTFLGKAHQYLLDTRIGTISVNSPEETVFKVGDTIKIFLPPQKIILV